MAGSFYQILLFSTRERVKTLRAESLIFDIKLKILQSIDYIPLL